MKKTNRWNVEIIDFPIIAFLNSYHYILFMFCIFLNQYITCCSNIKIISFSSFRNQDAPEIEVEFPFVHTGVGYDTQLVCIVHAEPTPQVVWYKHNTQLGSTEQYSQQVWCRFLFTDTYIYIYGLVAKVIWNLCSLNLESWKPIYVDCAQRYCWRFEQLHMSSNEPFR